MITRNQPQSERQRREHERERDQAQLSSPFHLLHPPSASSMGRHRNAVLVATTLGAIISGVPTADAVPTDIHAANPELNVSLNLQPTQSPPPTQLAEARLISATLQHSPEHRSRRAPLRPPPPSSPQGAAAHVPVAADTAAVAEEEAHGKLAAVAQALAHLRPAPAPQHPTRANVTPTLLTNPVLQAAAWPQCA